MSADGTTRVAAEGRTHAVHSRFGSRKTSDFYFRDAQYHTFWSATCLAACLVAMASFVRRFLSTDSGMIGLDSELTMAGIANEYSLSNERKERVRGAGDGNDRSQPRKVINASNSSRKPFSAFFFSANEHDTTTSNE